METSKMLLFTKRAPPKVPKRRSRAGCTYCKEKKKKCNEERPQCDRCAERGIECSYEPVKPRQRRKRDSITSPSTKPNGNRPPYLAGHYALEGGSSDESDSTSQAADFHYAVPPEDQVLWEDLALISPLEMPSPSTLSFDAASLMAAFSAMDDSVMDVNALSPMSSLPCLFLPDDQETLERSRRASTTSLPSRSAATHYFAHHSRRSSVATTASAAVSRSLIPDLAMIAPTTPLSPLLGFRAPAFAEFSSRPNRRALVDHFCNVLSHLIVFREESGNPFQQLVLPLTARSGTVTDAMYALASAHLEYRGVENGERSVHFHSRAIQGLARLIEREKGKGQDQDQDQDLGLEQGRGDGRWEEDAGRDRNELLAAIMLLVYYEVLVQKGRSNIVEGHLKGALAIMCSHPEPSDPTGIFLERAFRFYDVIAALSNGTAPLSAAPGAGCLVPFPPLGAPATSPLSNVDTLLGMATTLWPVIHRLSNLPALRAELEQAERAGSPSTKIAVLRTELDTAAQAIEAALTAWTPHLPESYLAEATGGGEDDAHQALARAVVGEVEGLVERGVELNLDEIDPDPRRATTAGNEKPACSGGPATTTRKRLHSILHNALAYRHSALVYLYRTVHGLGRSHGAVQRHARAGLRHCAATVAAGGPMGALLWPLFVAACEAVGPADRALARDTFLGVEKRQGMMNIERAWSIVEEVWKRADEEAGRQEEEEEREGQGQGREERGGVRVVVSPSTAQTAGMCGRERVERRGSRCAAGLRRTGADLWRRVSEDMGVNIVFG